MSKLNRELFDSCQSDGLLITAFYGVLDPREQTLTYTSAGHEPPILIKSAGKYVNIENTDILIGALKEVDYSNYRVPIGIGDVIALFSDGITEAGNPGEEMFERHSVCRAIFHSKEGSSRMIADSVFKRLKAFLNGDPLNDDCTLSIIKIVEIDDNNS